MNCKLAWWIIPKCFHAGPPRRWSFRISARFLSPEDCVVPRKSCFKHVFLKLLALLRSAFCLLNLWNLYVPGWPPKHSCKDFRSVRTVQYDLFIHTTPFPESPQGQAIHFLEWTTHVVQVIECGIIFMRCCRQNRQALMYGCFALWSMCMLAAFNATFS